MNDAKSLKIKERRESSDLNDEEYVEEYLDDAQESRTDNESFELDNTENLKRANIVQIENQQPQFLNANALNVNFENYIAYIAQIDNSAPIQQNVKQTESCEQQPTKKLKLSANLNSNDNLKNKRILSEIKYLKSKTEFYAQEQHKLKTQRTLLLLEIKKTRLEIEKLEKK